MILDETDLDALEAAAAGVLRRTPSGRWLDVARRDFTDCAPRLERGGLLERIEGASDTRGVPIQLTAKGERARQLASPVR